MPETFWGAVSGRATAFDVASQTPADPTTQGYVLYWNILNYQLDWMPLNYNPTNGDAAFSGNLSLATGKAYKINNVQVVAARKTGWTAPTGTASRATFAPATVTLVQLAQTLKALVDDLTSHGLIGA